MIPSAGPNVDGKTAASVAQKRELVKKRITLSNCSVNGSQNSGPSNSCAPNANQPDNADADSNGATGQTPSALPNDDDIAGNDNNHDGTIAGSTSIVSTQSPTAMEGGNGSTCASNNIAAGCTTVANLNDQQESEDDNAAADEASPSISCAANSGATGQSPIAIVNDDVTDSNADIGNGDHDGTHVGIIAPISNRSPTAMDNNTGSGCTSSKAAAPLTVRRTSFPGNVKKPGRKAYFGRATMDNYVYKFQPSVTGHNAQRRNSTSTRPVKRANRLSSV